LSNIAKYKQTLFVSSVHVCWHHRGWHGIPTMNDKQTSNNFRFC